MRYIFYINNNIKNYFENMVTNNDTCTGLCSDVTKEIKTMVISLKNTENSGPDCIPDKLPVKYLVMAI